jgi:hypothetical protein
MKEEKLIKHIQKPHKFSVAEVEKLQKDLAPKIPAKVMATLDCKEVVRSQVLSDLFAAVLENLPKKGWFGIARIISIGKAIIKIIENAVQANADCKAANS